MDCQAERPAPGAASRLDIEWVQDEAGFLSLRDAWNALAETIRSPSVFLRHEWFDAAWQWRKQDSALALICVRRAGHLVGIGPFVWTRGRRHGLPVRRLEFLTVPDTQFCDVLISRDGRAAIAAALTEALVGARPRWDLLELNRLTVDSAARELLPPPFGAKGLTHRVRTNDVNLYVDLTPGWREFYAGRSRRLKKANNLVANRLQRAVERIEIECVAGTSPDALAAAAGTTVALSAQSWKKRTGLSLDQPGPGAFFRRLVEHARDSGWLTVWLLRLNGTAVAMELQLAYRGQVHALRADFDPAFEPHSPGTYLNWKLLEALFSRGLARYWFGPGRNRYKLHWTEIGEPLYMLTAYNHTLRGRWLALYETTLRPWLKRLLRREAVTTGPDSTPPPP